ncbi:MAG TPA: polysaccharide deacetylase family protein, partial [Firmicutes bacterium]|nr:polysaccharide deacetylase family protein [Bacillota bacterium]
MFYHVRIKKKIISAIIFILATLLVIYLIKGQITENVFQASLDEAIYFTDTENKIVSFTFDIFVGADYVDEILTLLQQYNVKSTFFVTGHWVEENPELAVSISARHELGSSGYSIKRFKDLSNSELINDFEECRRVFLEISGREPEYFRPPYGEYDERIVALARDYNQKVILWSIETKDWTAKTMEEMLSNIMGKLHPGGILIFRASSAKTVMILPLVIAALTESGYHVVP